MKLNIINIMFKFLNMLYFIPFGFIGSLDFSLAPTYYYGGGVRQLESSHCVYQNLSGWKSDSKWKMIYDSFSCVVFLVEKCERSKMTIVMLHDRRCTHLTWNAVLYKVQYLERFSD